MSLGDAMTVAGNDTAIAGKTNSNKLLFIPSPFSH